MSPNAEATSNVCAAAPNAQAGSLHNHEPESPAPSAFTLCSRAASCSEIVDVRTCLGKHGLTGIVVAAGPTTTYGPGEQRQARTDRAFIDRRADDALRRRPLHADMPDPGNPRDRRRRRRDHGQAADPSSPPPEAIPPACTSGGLALSRRMRLLRHGIGDSDIGAPHRCPATGTTEHRATCHAAGLTANRDRRRPTRQMGHGQPGR